MATRRQFSREFKVEAVKLVTERGVGVSQGTGFDVGETVLRRWMRELTQDPQQAFPGKGIMKPEQAEIDKLRKEVAKLKMERDILKKPWPTSPGNRCEIRFRCEAPIGLAAGIDMRGSRCLARRLLCVVEPPQKPTQPSR